MIIKVIWISLTLWCFLIVNIHVPVADKYEVKGLKFVLIHYLLSNLNDNLAKRHDHVTALSDDCFVLV